MNTEDRFAEKVHKDRATGCWLWTAGRTAGGYGKFSVSGRTVLAHRYSWLRARGAVPRGLLVLHTCDNRVCVNPAHLKLGTQKQNMQDASAKGRLCCGSRHRVRRHPQDVRGARNGMAKLTSAQVREIRRMFKAGAQRADIARAFGVSWSHVNRLVRGRVRQYDGARGALLKGVAYCAGERSPATRLTDRQVRQVRKACLAGATQDSVAARYGVSQSYVSRLVRFEIRKTA